MKLKVSDYLLIFFLLLSLFVIGQSLTFHYWEAMILPLLFGSVILIASAWDLGREFKIGKNKTEMDTVKVTREGTKSEVQLNQFTATLIWIVGFSLGTYILGFVISIPLFIVFYLRWCSRGWLIAIFLALIMTISVYALFNLVFDAYLYKGVIWELISS